MRLAIVVSGRVQGVGYRAFTRACAEKWGVKGWVRNGVDGRTVEIEVIGAAPAVEKFVHELRQGPPLARVEQIQSRASLETAECARFEIRY